MRILASLLSLSLLLSSNSAILASSTNAQPVRNTSPQPATATPSDPTNAIAAMRGSAQQLLQHKHYIEAKQLLEKALSVCEQAHNTSTTKISILTDLAHAADLSGDSAQSSQFYDRAVQAAEKAYGPSDARVANLLVAQASFHIAHSQYAEAELPARRAVDIYSATTGFDNENAAEALTALTETYRQSKRFQDAERSQKLLIEATKKLYGADDKRVADCLIKLGLIQHKINSQNADYVQSIASAIHILDRLHAPEEDDVFMTLADLNGEESCCEHALSVAVARDGEYSKSVEDLLIKIVDMVDRKEITDLTARINWWKRLERVEEKRGDVQGLATTLEALDKLTASSSASAEEWGQARLKAVTAADPDNKRRIADAYRSLALSCEGKNQLESAADYYSKALDLERSTSCSPVDLYDHATHLSELQEQLGHHELATRTVDQVGWRFDFLRATNHLRVHDFPEARRISELSLQECSAIPDLKAEAAESAGLAALAEEASGNQARARQLQLQSIKWQQELGDKTMAMFVARWRYAVSLWSTGDKANAQKQGALAIKSVELDKDITEGFPEYKAQPSYARSEELLEALFSSDKTLSLAKLHRLADSLISDNEYVLALRLHMYCHSKSAASSTPTYYSFLAEKERLRECRSVERMISRRLEERLRQELGAADNSGLAGLPEKVQAAVERDDLKQALKCAQELDSKLSALPAASVARAYAGWPTASILAKSGDVEASRSLYQSCLVQARHKLDTDEFKLLIFTSAINVETSDPVLAVQLYLALFGPIPNPNDILGPWLIEGRLHALARLRAILRDHGSEESIGKYFVQPYELAQQFIDCAAGKPDGQWCKSHMELYGGLQPTIDFINASAIWTMCKLSEQTTEADVGLEQPLAAIVAEHLKANEYHLKLDIFSDLLEVAKVCQRTGNLTWAESAVEIALETDTAKANPACQARCKGIQAEIALDERDGTRAETLANDIIGSITLSSDTADVLATAYAVLARKSLNQGDFKSALSFAEQLNKLPTSETQSRFRRVRILTMLAESAMKKSDLTSAGIYLSQAHDLVEKPTSDPGAVKSKCELLISYVRYWLTRNDVDRANKIATELMQTQQQLNLREDVEVAATSLNLCALVASRRGNAELARRLIFQSSDTLDKYCEMVFLRLSFSGQTEFAKTLENQRDYLLTFCTQPSDAGATFDYVAHWKGLLTEVLRLQSYVLRTEPNMQQLLSARAQLAAAIGTPEAKKYSELTDVLERRAMFDSQFVSDLRQKAIEVTDVEAQIIRGIKGENESSEPPSAEKTGSPPKSTQPSADKTGSPPQTTQPSADQTASPPQTAQTSTATAASERLPTKQEIEAAERTSVGAARLVNDLELELVISGAHLRALLKQNEILKLAVKQRQCQVVLKPSLDDLSRYLKSDQRYIDLSQYTDLRTNEQKYAAFVIGSDRASLQNTHFIDLGQCSVIDESIAQWLHAAKTDTTPGSNAPEARLANQSGAARSIVVVHESDSKQPELSESNSRQRLRELLWQPLSKALPDNAKRIWLCADGELARVPWQWLEESGNPAYSSRILICQVDSPRRFCQMSEGQRAAADSNVDALIDGLPGGPPKPTKTNTGAPAAEPDKAGSEPAKDRLLIVGNLDFKDAPRLPGTALEVEQVAALMKSNGGETNVLTKDQGDPATVLAALSNCTYAHFATHGYFYQMRDDKDKTSRSPNIGPAARGIEDNIGAMDPILQRSTLLQSGLLLSPGKDPEYASGRLSAAQLLDADLSKCKLLVLSACETGRGAEITGQGVIGLRAAAVAAGAHTVVMSLWKVSDDATEQLMTLFYENLLQRKLDPYTALIQAQSKLRQNPRFEKPYYWAGWVVVGSD